MANAPTQIVNAGYALFDLAKSRDAAIRSYSDYKKNILDSHFTIADGEYLEATHNAFIKRNDLVKKVFEESEKFFNMLDESLQFGLKELDKPLILPSSGPSNPTQVRCLVVKLKPVETSNSTLQVSVAPEYSYDVQMVDFAGK